MASRTEYNNCMKPYISGKGLSKEERQANFCGGAKVCTGKAKNLDEGIKICASEPPKEPKAKRSRGAKCTINAPELAQCVIGGLNLAQLTDDNFQQALEASIGKCSIGKTGKVTKAAPPTYVRFMNNCLKEAGGNVDFVKSQGIIKTCQAEWKVVRDGI